MQIPNYNYSVSLEGNITNLSTDRVVKPSINPQNGYLYVALWKNGIGKTYSVHRLVANAYCPNPENKPNVNHIDSDRTNCSAENLEWVTQSENLKHGYEHGNMSQDFRKKLVVSLLNQAVEGILDNQTQSSLAAYMGVSEGRLSVMLKQYLLEDPRKELVAEAKKNQKKLRNQYAAEKNRIQIAQICPKTGKEVKIYTSLWEAARALNMKGTGSISNAANPNMSQKTAGGFLWKYL